jgi:aminobenzoyl-glutamate utilization protein A
MSRNIQQLTDQLYPALIEWRRDFHKHAESGWVEFRTASKVAAKLHEWGYNVQAGAKVVKGEARMGVPAPDYLAEQEQRAISQGAEVEWLPYLSGGFTGVVGTLETGRPGPTVAFRVDMDALDIAESTDPSHFPSAKGFRSINPRMMHACGHDAHTAIGLGLARLLTQLKDELVGRIKLIFQPAEEGVRGAKAMVEAGVTDDVDIFFAAHVGCGMPLGSVVCGVEGHLATTKVDLEYTGVASHTGSKPEEGKNALLAAAAAVLNLHAISRHGAGASRINVGVLNAGSGRNVIPHLASFKLETRGDTDEINDYILEQALQVIRGAAVMYGVSEKVEIVGKAGSAVSSSSLIPFIRSQAEKVAEVRTILDRHHSGGSEDATYFINRVQEHGGLAAYLVFGTTLAAGHHNEKFDIDEQVLKIAVKTLAYCALHAGELQREENA